MNYDHQMAEIADRREERLQNEMLSYRAVLGLALTQLDECITEISNADSPDNPVVKRCIALRRQITSNLQRKLP